MYGVGKSTVAEALQKSYHYRTQYAQEHDIQVYDVTNERQSGSRRY